MNDDTLVSDKWTAANMVEVTLKEPDDFLRVKETLTRIGVSATSEGQVLYQSCHILHKQGRYFIVHFKELFLLDGKRSSFSENDRLRRNTITTLLSDWGLLEIVDAAKTTDRCSVNQIKILPFKEKKNWNLVAKYTIGSDLKNSVYK